jgi:hypothetical protein
LQDTSLIRTIGDILADYSRVATSFDQAVRLLNDIQIGQQHQAELMGHLAQGFSRFGAGLETLTDGVSRTVTTELAATRALIHDMEHAHSSNLRLLSNNHAQTAVQIAAAIEQSAALVERMPPRVAADIEAKIDDVVREAMRPMGLTVAQQMHRIEGAFSQLSAERHDNPSVPAGEHGSPPSSGEPSGTTRSLEDRISERLDRLDQNVGAAFSAYSGILKLAVAALDKHGNGESRAPEHPIEPVPGRMKKLAG